MSEPELMRKSQCTTPERCVQRTRGLNAQPRRMKGYSWWSRASRMLAPTAATGPLAPRVCADMAGRVPHKPVMLASRLQRLFRPRPPLGSAELGRWDRDGFLILRDFMPRGAICALRDAVDREWANAAGNDHEID